MNGGEQVGLAVRVATVVAPVAVYFLILGLLNSRRHPQLLRGRLDFGLLVAAASPLLVVPVLELLGPSLAAILSVGSLTAGIVALLAPRGHSWVVYNVPADQAADAVARALRGLGAGFVAETCGFRLLEGRALVRLQSLPLLRNVSIRLEGGEKELARRFEASLAGELESLAAETPPMAVAMLLVATAMLVAPLALVAHRVPEIVRLLTDLL